MKTTYTFSMSGKDWASAALLRLAQTRVPLQHRILLFVVNISCFGALAALVGMALDRRNVPSSAVLYAAAIALFALFAAQFVVISMRRALLRRATSVAGPTTMRVDDSGVSLEKVDGSTYRAWSGLGNVEIKGDYLFLHDDSVHFQVVPLAAFASREDANAIVELWRERRLLKIDRPQVGETCSARTPLNAGDLPAKPRVSLGSSLAGVALDALRLTFLRALPENRPSLSWGGVLALALADIAVPVVAAFASVGMHGEWSWYSLASSLLHLPLMLGAAIVASLVVRRPEEVVRVLAAGLLVSIVIDLAWAALTTAFPNLAEMAYANCVLWIPAAWLALAMGTFACRSIEPGVRRLVILASVALIVAVPLGTTFRDRGFWHAPFDPEDGGGRDRFGVAAEAAFYKQPQVLAQELQSVRPATRDAVNVYFIGMAGYGNQDVFRKEVESVATLFRERFGAGGHTVRLINSNRTLLDVPIASATSLRAALRRVAQAMDKDRDVLVLYMTSHGSSDHQFSLSLWPLSFERLDPAVLRGALDESGIRNRVVIISACYSGGFVKPLEGPDTLVITASAADRTSFGCSDDATWTYFGKAYFDEALRHTHSFIDAFEAAKPRIARREVEGNFTPSEPQISVGAHIRAKLAELSDQVEGRLVKTSSGVGAADRPHQSDLYDQYVDLTYRYGYLRDMKELCKSSMHANGPEEGLAKFPNAFDGMDKSPRHWNRLLRAWDTYGEDLCSRSLEPHALRAAYAEKVRALVPESDLVPVVHFLRSAEGGHWLQAEQQIARQQQAEITRQQTALSLDLYADYLKEMDRIKADFRKSRP